MNEGEILLADIEYLAGPHEPWCNFIAHADCCHDGKDEQLSCECGVWQRKQDIAAALAEERERERLQWNPMIGRVLQVAMKWTNSGDPRLAACAQQIHAAIGGSQ